MHFSFLSLITTSVMFNDHDQTREEIINVSLYWMIVKKIWSFQKAFQYIIAPAIVLVKEAFRGNSKEKSFSWKQ